MPLQYIYRVGTKSTLSKSYTTSNTAEATGVTRAITAGLSAARGGASGSFSTAITNAMEKSRKTSKFTGNVKQRSVGFGSNVDTDCFENNTCTAVITRSVKSIREDYTKLGSPSSLGREFKSLDDIMKLYFGGRYGLPDAFLSAYNAYGYNQPGSVCWNSRICTIGRISGMYFIRKILLEYKQKY